MNVPFAPGDRLLTSVGRPCEVEFDTGTVVQLDGATRIRLETVLAPSLSSERRLTNLVLEGGRVRVRYQGYGRSEMFQVLTANAAVKVDRSAVVEIAAASGGETRFAVESGRAAVLFGPSEGKVHRRSLKIGASLSIRQDQAIAGLPPARDAFTEWALTRDRERARPDPSGRPLSATIRDLSPVVVEFAERYSRTHGEWVWTRYKEHAWRPHLNDDAGVAPLHPRSLDDGRRPALLGRRGTLGLGSGTIWGTGTKIRRRAGSGCPGRPLLPPWATWVGCGDVLGWWPFGPRDWLRFRKVGMPPSPSCESMDYSWYSYPWSTGRQDPSRPVEYAKRRGSTGPEPPPPLPDPRPEAPPSLASCARWASRSIDSSCDSNPQAPNATRGGVRSRWRA